MDENDQKREEEEGLPEKAETERPQEEQQQPEKKWAVVPGPLTYGDRMRKKLGDRQKGGGGGLVILRRHGEEGESGRSPGFPRPIPPFVIRPLVKDIKPTEPWKSNRLGAVKLPRKR